MCGISGQLRLDGGAADRALVRRMTSRLSHRGPDGEGYYFQNCIGLGHNRLSIIDLDHGGQPMFADGESLVLISNNEIYNYPELREELEREGTLFRSTCDSEVIVHLFAREREKSFARLEGMFAFAIWDVNAETLYLVRDRFGIKPLHYTCDGESLIFASEMRALLEYPQLDRTLDAGALDGYFATLAVPEPRSVFRSVRKLPPGSYVTARRGEIREHSYWKPDFSSARLDLSQAAAGAMLMSQLERSIGISMRSDVPLGVLLSGGLDSSTVTAIAARHSAEPLHTFTATFREEEFSEAPYSAIVAKRFGTRHHNVAVTRKRATSIALRLLEEMDEPFADSSTIPTSAVCELARRYVKVVLSGEGADELFGGYPWHSRQRAAVEEHPARVVFTRRQRQELYTESWMDQVQKSEGMENDRPNDAGLSPLHQSLLDDLQRYLPSDILFKSDRVSMQHSLELRVPFLNHELANLAIALPERLKVRGEARKVLLRRIAAGFLPKDVIDRPKKGFSIPMDLWLWEKGRWRDMIYDTIFSRRTIERGQFNEKTLLRLQREHERLQSLHGYQLWSVFVFEMWQRRFLDAR